jgi:hypothetical protein
VDCTSCTGYPGQPNPTGTFACSDGCGTYTVCYTPIGCPNYTLTPCPGCPPPPPPPPSQYTYCPSLGYSIPVGSFCPGFSTPPPPPPPPPPPSSFCFFCPAELGCFCIGDSCFC